MFRSVSFTLEYASDPSWAGKPFYQASSVDKADVSQRVVLFSLGRFRIVLDSYKVTEPA